jgi:proline iminopeptidase
VTPADDTAYSRLLAFRRSLPRTPRLERQTVRVRGGPLAVFSSPFVADRPPLLCVNGGMIYGHDMLWPSLAALAIRRQLVFYDQRGRGESPAPSNPAAATVHDDAEDIGALRRALGIRRWDVLGHSWGGGIALLAAALDPAGVRRLVTVDAVGPTSAWMPGLRANVLARLHGDQREAVARVSESELTRPDPELHSLYASAVYPAWFSQPGMAEHFTPPRALSLTGAAVLARLRGGYDWRERIGSISVPTLVIHGEGDPLPAAVATDISYIAGTAPPTLIPASGHMPFWEAPDPFFAAVEAFL